MNIRNVSTDRIDMPKQTSPAGEKAAQPSVPVAEQTTQTVPNREKIQEALLKMNLAASEVNNRLSFSYNEEVNRIVVKVVNQDTNEVIREIPPRDIINLVKHIQDYLGLVFDESR